MSEEDHATIEGLDLHRQSITLSGFLLDRIAEDEAAARACPAGFASSGISDAASRHILNWPPHRVLAECEAKRRIVGMFDNGTGFSELLALLALPYAGHPDYRRGWAS